MKRGISEFLNYNIFATNLSIASDLNPDANKVFVTYALAESTNNPIINFKLPDGSAKSITVETTASIKDKLGTASTSAAGYVTSTDWNTFNNKPNLGTSSTTAFRGDYGNTAYNHSQASGNVHGLTLANLGIGNIDNTSDANKPISTAVATALGNKVDNTITINSKQLNTNITLSASDIGLGNVTNDSQVKRSEMGAASGVATLDADGKIVQNIAASKVTGVLSIDNIPAGAIERVVPVTNDTARFALTTATVQLGDTVKVVSTGIMYMVKDEANLGNETGYEVYVASVAAAVAWTGVSSVPAHITEVGSITAANNDFIVQIGGAFTNRTPAQVKTILAVDNVSNAKCNLNASVAPGVSDDNVAGYSVDSRWIDTTHGRIYICVSAATGAAVWKDITGNADKLQGIPIASTTPTNGQTYIYNSTSGQFEPGTVSTGGGSSTPDPYFAALFM